MVRRLLNKAIFTLVSVFLTLIHIPVHRRRAKRRLLVIQQKIIPEESYPQNKAWRYKASSSILLLQAVVVVSLAHVVDWIDEARSKTFDNKEGPLL